MVGLDSLESVHGCRLRLTNHLDLGPASHPRTFSGLQSSVLGGIAPDSWAGEDKFDTGRGHKRLAVSPCQCVHGVLIDLGEIVADGVDNILVEALELGGSVERANIEGKFLRTIQEQFNATETRLLRLELEAPFRRGFSA